MTDLSNDKCVIEKGNNKGLGIKVKHCEQPSGRSQEVTQLKFGAASVP